MQSFGCIQTLRRNTDLLPLSSVLKKDIKAIKSRLGDVVVGVLATGPKGCGFEPGQGDGFLRAIKIRSTPSSRMGNKAGSSHVVRFYGMLKNCSKSHRDE
jgi:hypothetical protein